MKAPAQVKTYEGELATFWFDEDGILYAVGKQVPRDVAKQKANFEFIKKISGNKKVCLLSNVSSSSPQDKEVREYIAEAMPEYFKAMAVVATSTLGKFIVNLFLTLKKTNYPP